MKLWIKILFMVLLNCSVIPVEANDLIDTRKILETRLKGLQNLSVEYDVNQLLAPPPPQYMAKMKRAIQNMTPSTGTVLPNAGVKRMSNKFLFLNGRGRHESKIIDVERMLIPEGMELKEFDYKVLVVSGDRSEQLTHQKGDKQYRGVIYTEEDNLRLPLEIQVCLGLSYPWTNTYLDSTKLDKMEFSPINGRIVVMKEIDINGSIHEWTFDKQLGYALTSYKHLFLANNHLNMEAIMTDFKNTNDLMLPSKAVIRRFKLVDGESHLVEESSFNVHKYKLNDPCNVPETYKIMWPDNTIVYDKKIDMSFLYNNGYMELKDGSVYEVELGDIDNILVDISQQSAKPADFILIPKMTIALKRNKPFVFDLASGKFLDLFTKVDSEQAHKKLLKLGKGDIAWDGSLITVRKAKALTVSNKSHNPLKHTIGRWCNQYKLPEKMELPYSVLVVSIENIHYLVTIHAIETSRIKIAYKKLSSDEVKHYLPTETKKE